MSRDVTAEFFDELADRGFEPLLAKTSGCARFDVVGGKRTERWLVTIERGEIGVSRGSGAADAVLQVDRACFERVVAGEQNFLAAVLRGEVAIAGDPRFLVRLQRLLPRPQGRGTQQRATAAVGRDG